MDHRQGMRTCNLQVLGDRGDCRYPHKDVELEGRNIEISKNE